MSSRMLLEDFLARTSPYSKVDDVLLFFAGHVRITV